MLTKRFFYLLIFSVAVLFSLKSYGQQPVFTVSDVKGACEGFFNGSFVVTVTSATGDANIFYFGTAAGGPFPAPVGVPVSITGLRPGGYLVVVQDEADGSSMNVTVDSYPDILTASVDNITNNSSCVTPNGSIDITPSGGSGPPNYSFSWTGPNGFTATTEDISGLAGGNYSVLISDNNTNCTELLTPIVVTDPSPTVFNVTTPSPLAVCNGSDWTLTIDGSEVGATYEVFRNNSINTGISETGTGSPISFVIPWGTFASGNTFKVTASNGFCTPIDMNGVVIVSIVPLPTVSNVSGGGTVCAGDPYPNVTFTFTGATPFTFTYTDGTTPVTVNNHPSTTFTITNAPPGTYQVTALTDGNGCNAVSLGGSVSVIENALPTATISGGGPVCVGDPLPDVTFTFTGATPFTFTYTDGVTPVTVNNHPNNTFTISNAPAGTYSITALSDGNGCNGTNFGTPVDVIVNPLPTVDTATGGGSVCAGDPLPDVTFTFTGTAPFIFTYTDGTTPVVVNNHPTNTFTINNAPAGTYSITALTDDNGCDATDLGGSVVVIENALPTASISGGGPVCAGDPLPNVTFTFTGATPFTFTYTDGVTPVTINNHPTNIFIINNAPAGTYSITALSDGNGCNGTDFGTPVDVIVNPLPTVDTATGGGTVCDGDVLPDVTFTFTGTAPFTFTYTDGTTPVVVNNHPTNSFTINNAPAGTYQVTALSDGNGCAATDLNGNVVVIVNPLPTASISGGGTVCAGDPLPDVVFTFTGTAPFTFTYSDGVVPVVVNNHPTNTFTIPNASVGTYSVTALSDGNGCNATDFGTPVDVSVNPLPTVVSVTGGGVVCEGDPLPDITFTFTGTTPFTFTYTDAFTPVTITNHPDPTYTINGASEGIYQVTALTDGNGCDATDLDGTAQVFVNPAPTASISGGGIVCAGDALPDVTFTFIGALPYDFTYTDGVTPVTIINHLDNFFTITNAPAGTYEITALSDGNGCAGTDLGTPVDVIVNPLPVPGLTGPATSCFGSTELYNTEPGQSNYIWTVQGGSVTSGGGVNDASITILWDGAGPYSVSVSYTDVNNCPAAAPTVQAVTIDPAPTVDAGLPQIVCSTDDVTLGGSIGGSAVSATWTTAGDGTFNDATLLAATYTPGVNDIAAGSVTLTLTTDATASCPSVSDNVTITLTPLPTTADAGSDQTVCSTTDLEGNTPVFGTGTWTIVSGAGGSITTPNSPTSSFSGVAGEVYVLEWTITNGTCPPSVDQVEITFDVNTPTIADAGGDQNICSSVTTDATLLANTPVIGTGEWSIVSGGGTFSDITSPGAIFSGVAGETHVLRWTITSTCGTSQDDVTISFELDPSTADAGADQQVCSPSATMTAVPPTSGAGQWSVVSGAGGSFADTADPATSFSGNTGVTYVLRWTVSNTCGSSTDDVEIIFENTVTVADAGADKTICGTTNLEGNVPLVGTGQWSIVNGAGGVLVDPSDPTSEFSGVAGTVYTLEWTITAGSCPPSADQVLITIDPDSPTPANAGPDQQVCDTDATLAANSPATGTGQWSIVSGAGGSFLDDLDPATTFSGNAGETYVLQWTITSTCGSVSDDVQIIFDENPTVADAGADQAVCGPANLDGNVPVIGTGEWTIVNGAGGVLADASDPQSLFQGIGGTVYTLQWTIINGVCPPSVDQVEIALDANTPTIADAGPDQNICDITATLAGNTPVVGDGIWTIESGAGGSFVDDTDPTTVFNGVAGETYTLRWTISSILGCTPSMDEVTILFDIAPTTPDAGPDQQECGTTVTLAANAPVSGSGLWTVVSGAGGSFADDADPATDFTGTAGITYVLRWTISNSCDTNSDDVEIILDLAPTVADAGADKTVCGPTDLEGNTPVTGTGTWTIVSGVGGVLADANDPASLFSGLAGTTYVLEWTIINATCPSSADQVEITFDPDTPTIADAGPDQNICAITTTLAANTPVIGTGEWSVVSGAGGSFADDTDPVTDFDGVAGTAYVLRWTISGAAGCTPSTDDVTIFFETAPTVADAGPNQQICGTDAILAANTPASGSGLWTITSGVGGAFDDDTDPFTQFTGTTGETYVLRWTISNSCGSSFSEVTIQLNVPPTVANAGPDQVLCGTTFANLAGNAPGAGNTGLWIVISGTGGAALTPNSPTSQFAGLAGTSYTVRWVISNGGACPPSTDDVVINFAASPTVSSPVNVCVNSAAPTLAATATGATSIQWYSDAALTVLVFTGNNYTPAAAQLNMNVVGGTTFYVTATYACGVSLASEVVVNVTDGPGCGGGGADCFAYTVLVVDAQTQRPSCNDQDDGVITFNITGTTPGNYIIQLISPTDTLTQIGPSGVYTFTNLSAANYSYRLTDVLGNVCQQPYNLPLSTIVEAVASNPVDAICFGDPTGSVTMTITGGSSPYEYSLDGLSWTPGLISGGQITGLPPNGTYPILVRNDASDLCPAEVLVTINSINTQIIATFAVTPATCNGGDGAIAITGTSGGSGSGYEYSINGGAFGPGPFNNLDGGVYTITVRDDSGCTQNIDVPVTFPGFVNHSVTASDADCTNNGFSGSIVVNIPGPGTFQVALSTDQFNAPDDFEFTPYVSPQISYDTLPRGTYFVYIKTAGASCPTRSAPINIQGAYAITFDIVPVCNEDRLTIALTNITGDPDSGLEIRVFKKFASSPSATIFIPFLPPTGNYLIEYGTVDVLLLPGEYLIQIVQVQPSCFFSSGPALMESPFVDYTVPVPLFAAIGETKKSYPDILNGSMQIINFSGPGPDYMTSIRLDSASVPGQTYQTGPDVVPVNLNNQYEIEYKNIPAGRYEVIVTDRNGCSRILIGRVPLDTDIYIPNVFTPNGDGVNDVFFIRNLPVNGNSNLIISNRWGAQVFASTNYQNNWDGGEVSDGVYFYRLKVPDAEAITGWVEILRGVKP